MARLAFFIDGDHKYESALTYWLLYKRLDCKGGIIAFHDILSDNGRGGVPLLVGKLSKGEIDGTPRHPRTIEISKNTGIALYLQE